MPISKSHKLLVICGPTATGKTRLAAILAKKFKGEIISADSRQVYKALDIGTGKDSPRGVKIWGYDLVDPKEGFSVAQYRSFALKIIYKLFRSGKLPILTGGTGLYIRSLVDGISTVNIPRNQELRQVLEKKTPTELFESLAQIDALKAASMNCSDKANPRRLVRAIEIATWNIDNKTPPGGKLTGLNLPKENVLFIGLTAPDDYLFQLIKGRVRDRIKMGVEKEIAGLLKNGVTWDTQAMTSLGYRQWQAYFEGKEERATAILNWEKEEIKYVKRQLTWFKNDPRISWVDISVPGVEKKVEGMVKKWYDMA